MNGLNESHSSMGYDMIINRGHHSDTCAHTVRALNNYYCGDEQNPDAIY